jgi:hypothetical protein
VQQVASNLQALTLPNLTKEQLQGVQEVYETFIKKTVHHLW